MTYDVVKFLLVDDIAENLDALEALLRRDRLELHRARSGAEALELLLMHDYALALLDVQMPEMDGFTLAELMRSTERTRRVPIIFLTAVATDDRRLFRGYGAGAVDYLFKPIDSRLLLNKAEVFFELDRQKRELARRNDELRVSTDSLSRALDQLQAHRDNSPLASAEFGPDLRVSAWSRGAERMFGWRADEALGRSAEELRWIRERDAEVFANLTRSLAEGRSPRGMHAFRSYRKNGEPILCEWYISSLAGSEGGPASVSAQILDISERSRAEETRRLLVGELNHRVKNTLATVQAVASQTMRHARDAKEFAAAFTGRIQSLAKAHSLLSGSGWSGVMIGGLVHDQAQIGADEESHLTISGPEVFLEPQAALHIAMILHELATNAYKHGALSNAAGHAELTWLVEVDRLRMTWVERGAPEAAAPPRRGFGITLVEQTCQAAGGSAAAAWEPEGVVWRIDFPLPGQERQDNPRPAAVPAVRQVALAADPARKLAGRRFLVVEDEPVVALEVVISLEEAGADVVGPAATPSEALHLAASSKLDGALLDGNLRGERVDAVAEDLARRRIPFVFVTGYGRESLPQEFSDRPVISKPFAPRDILEAAAGMSGSCASGADRAASGSA